MADRDEIEWIKRNEPERLDEVPIEKVEWYKELEKIKGIGEETAKDLGRIYDSLQELKKAAADGSVPVRNDIIIKLKQNL